MEHVGIDIPDTDFASPYDAISVTIPQGPRYALGERFGIKRDQLPRQVLVRWIHSEGNPPAIMAYVGQRGIECPTFFHLHATNRTADMTLEERMKNVETHFSLVVHDMAGNGEKNRQRHEFIDEERTSNAGSMAWVKMNDYQPYLKFAQVATRAALNLCLYLTHVGHRVTYTVDTASAKSRVQRREFERKLERDFATIHMCQNIIIRQVNPPTDNIPGPGTGIEVRPHWRRGHWAAYPGQAKLRLEGKQPKLLFRRPCLVRRDRMTGDEAESQVTYRGT